jgi:hypothetical protein
MHTAIRTHRSDNNQSAHAGDSNESFICTVNSTLDAGSGSLRWCIEQVNADKQDRNTTTKAAITFAFDGTPPALIELKTTLPEVAGAVKIDARLGDGRIGVVVNGSSSRVSTGFRLMADGIELHGISVVHFTSDCVDISSFGFTRRQGWEAGSAGVRTFISGEFRGCGGSGIVIWAPADNVRVGDPDNKVPTVIGDNGSDGIKCEAHGLTVANTYVGVLPDGTLAPNRMGVWTVDYGTWRGHSPPVGVVIGDLSGGTVAVIGLPVLCSSPPATGLEPAYVSSNSMCPDILSFSSISSFMMLCTTLKAHTL